MRVFVFGVRGSTPAPGPDFVRYGGQTSCVAIASHGDHYPRLVLDAGTGLRRLTALLDPHPFRGTILLGHLHWDHTHGLPFFAAGDRTDSEVNLLLPSQHADPEELLARVMSPPHFPIRPGELRGSWRFGNLDEGEHAVEGFGVLALDIPHKGGRTFGFRITDSSGTAMAYLSDHSPTSFGDGVDGFGEYHPAAQALADGVDLLIHDAQYTAAELPARVHLGHSTVEYAVGLGEVCGVKHVLLYHHDPPRTDDELDAIVAAQEGRKVAVSAAAEGTIIDLSPSGHSLP